MTESEVPHQSSVPLHFLSPTVETTAPSQTIFTIHSPGPSRLTTILVVALLSQQEKMENFIVMGSEIRLQIKEIQTKDGCERSTEKVK